MHYLSSGAASFARGLNDTPKIVALLMVAPSVNVVWGSVGVAVMIAVGALVDAKNVAETLAKKVTDMNASQGFAASLVTAALVTTASFHSLPVSTTHVSVGSLTGTGVRYWQRPLAEGNGDTDADAMDLHGTMRSCHWCDRFCCSLRSLEAFACFR